MLEAGKELHWRNWWTELGFGLVHEVHSAMHSLCVWVMWVIMWETSTSEPLAVQVVKPPPEVSPTAGAGEQLCSGPAWEQIYKVHSVLLIQHSVVLAWWNCHSLNLILTGVWREKQHQIFISAVFVCRCSHICQTHIVACCQQVEEGLSTGWKWNTITWHWHHRRAYVYLLSRAKRNYSLRAWILSETLFKYSPLAQTVSIYYTVTW